MPAIKNDIKCLYEQSSIGAMISTHDEEHFLGFLAGLHWGFSDGQRPKNNCRKPSIQDGVRGMGVLRTLGNGKGHPRLPEAPHFNLCMTPPWQVEVRLCTHPISRCCQEALLVGCASLTMFP